MARRYRLSVTVALLSVLTACGARQEVASQPPPTSRPSTTTPTTSLPPPPTGGETSPPNQENRCTAAFLSGTVETTDSGAGSRSITLVVRNTSQQACTLWGFGGLEMLDATKQSIPTNAERNLGPGPTLVTLTPNATAGKLMRWSVVATGDEPTTGPCQQPATSINVTPPDETEAFEVNYELGPVCANGRIETSAYFAR